MPNDKNIESQVQDLREAVAVLRTKVEILCWGFLTTGGAVILAIIQQVENLLTRK